MAITDVIILLGIIGAIGPILYMLKEILKWDQSKVTGKNALLVVVGFFVLTIIFGKMIITELFNVIFSESLIVFWIFLILIVGIFLALFVGKLFKQW